MNLKWTSLSILLASALFLAACTSDEDNTKQKEDSTTEQQQPSEQTDGEQKEDDSTETIDEPVDDDSSEEPALREDEASLTYTLNGEQKEEIGYLTESDQQNYSLYKLDGYELTGEEPNKDALYATENDSVFMRIETISTDDADYEVILKNMMETMAAISIDEEPVTITEEGKLPAGEGIKNAVGYEVPKEIGTISGYVFERGDLIVRLTIFDRNDANLTDALLKMGETVNVK
ncbi:hypothetical protein ACFOZY_02995 [Chungangia koreensis]|uniref:Lipoprotein n=1 Tax=Chungangia koreensis TaxID=752657 RepID=A0ABV8X5Q0_9LACT